MKTKKTYNEILEEARVRTKKLNAEIESHPNYVQNAEEWDAEYAVVCAMNEARKQANLTQAELAKKMGISQPTISNMLRGHVTINTLIRFFAACDRRLVIQSVPAV